MPDETTAQAIQWKSGDRVLWGHVDPQPGTLIAPSFDEDDPEWVERCGDDTCPGYGEPTWMIEFDSGRVKPYCCLAVAQRIET